MVRVPVASAKGLTDEEQQELVQRDKNRLRVSGDRVHETTSVRVRWVLYAKVDDSGGGRCGASIPGVRRGGE